MSHSSVYSILQDTKGFMWFGTPDGLCRYDGSSLQAYKYIAKVEGDKVNNFVRGKMLEDKTGNIWYCNEAGIFKWDHLKEKIIKIKSFEIKDFKNSEFQSVYLDDKNSLWMFNIIFGIFEYKINTGKIIQYSFPYKIDFTSVVSNYTTVDPAGNIWMRISPGSGSFMVFNKSTLTYSDAFTSNAPDAIFFEQRKKIFAYENRLVFQDENKKEITVPKLINGKKISFYSFDGCRDKYGRLWMTARGNGLFYYDENKIIFHEFHHDNSKIKSLPFDLTTCLFIDRNENLWIGIDGGGVAKLDLKQPKFNLFPLSEGDYPLLNDYFTKCFYEDDRGRIWFGSFTNGLNIFDPNTLSLVNFHHEKENKNSLPGNIVASIIKDKDGNMLIGSSGGISIFNEKERSFKTIPIQGLPKQYPQLNNFIYKMLQLQNGDIIAATSLGIIKIIKQNDIYKGYCFNNNAPFTTVTTDVAEMPDKTIFAALPGNGLFQLAPDTQEHGYKLINTFLGGIDLRSIRIDERNRNYLWIGSAIGLIHFNISNHTYKVFNENSGMANSYVYGSLEDANGNFWISTNKGLSSFNQQKQTFENYSFLDGLQSNEFNTQAFYKSTTGVFYFGGIKGFNWFKPGNVSKEHIKPVAALTRIEINDSIYQKDSAYFLHQTITVAYDKNSFNFQFAALDYTRPEANKIQYNLEGWDAGWIFTNSNSARYANLNPGDYTLKLKVSNADGIWSDEERMNIIIQSPFYKRSWFIIMVALLLLIASAFISYTISQQKTKSKLRLLQQQIAVEAERNRISADMHDEIGSGITQIALLSELIQTQHKEEKEFKKDINLIATSARKLVQTISEIIWALSPQNDTLEDLLAYTREQSQEYFESMDMKFDIHFPDDIPHIKLTNAERRNLYLVTREALNNAMKHSEASAIHLKMEITNTVYCYRVVDNGKGINKQPSTSGRNGIKNMKKRMEDIGGTIKWIPQDKGTVVEYCLPV